METPWIDVTLRGANLGDARLPWINLQLIEPIQLNEEGGSHG